MKKLNSEPTAKGPLVRGLLVKEPLNKGPTDKESDNYSKMNKKLDKIIDIMSSMLSELKMLNNYNTDKIKSQSLFNPFSTSR